MALSLLKGPTQRDGATTMIPQIVFPPGFPNPRGAYSPAIKVPLGGATMLFVTGQLAIDPNGNVVGVGDAGEQTEYVFHLLERLLSEAGMAWRDVVKTQTFLTNMADYPKFAAVRDRLFATIRPASTLLEVKGLARPECCVEVELIAIK